MNRTYKTRWNVEGGGRFDGTKKNVISGVVKGKGERHQRDGIKGKAVLDYGITLLWKGTNVIMEIIESTHRWVQYRCIIVDEGVLDAAPIRLFVSGHVDFMSPIFR